ncbi:MAG: hypothetical protein HQK75_12120 [Candidatus Magnetomorum sp.]|nr:hypothetical protein [Candidatus Magnetomorum sp.]
MEKKEIISDKKQQNDKLRYEPPKIITYSEKEILEQIGPAQACSPQPCSINP